MAMKWLAAALLWALAGCAGAIGQLADVTLFDRTDNCLLPVHRHEGRYFVVGVPGHEYQVRVRNRTGDEVLAVVSVDGVNAVTGATASWEQSGYVLGAHQGHDIRGWRKSLRRLAAFYFTDHENAYASRTGRPDNVGVIGVAIFRKKHEPAARIESPVPRPWLQREESRDAPGEGAVPSAAGRGSAKPEAVETARHDQPRSAALGTGHGRSETSRASYANFERASARPAEVVAIHYDTYANLVAAGIIVRARPYVRPHSYPAPFPGVFVPDPR
jgi:hypothetical protein